MQVQRSRSGGGAAKVDDEAEVAVKIRAAGSVTEISGDVPSDG